AKQLVVGALPDVRLIAADGTQLWHLVGLTNAKKLSAALTSALKGESQRAPDSGPAAESRPRPAPTPEAIARAVARGASWLLRAAVTAKPEGQAFSTDEVALFALCAAGADRSDRDFGALRDRVIGRTPSKTYEVSLKASAL